MPPSDLAALRAPFPPEQIGKLPKGGVQLDYVGHADVTARLLDVDPEWSWEPMAVDPQGLPCLDRFGNLWIRLTVLGVTRLGVGDGKSMKECIGDALRNAAMRFGVALDLWAKGDRNFGPAGHDAPPAEQVSNVTALLAEIRTLAGSPANQRVVASEWLEQHGHPLRDTTDIGSLELLRDELREKAR